MLLLRGYNAYIWMFILGSLTLLCAALGYDMHTTGSENGSDPKFIHFGVVILCFFCSSASNYLNNRLFLRSIKLEMLHDDRKRWLSKFLSRRRSGSNLGRTKIYRRWNLCFLHVIANATNLLPILTCSIIVLCGQDTWLGEIKQPIFLALGVTMKYIAWTMVLLFSKVFVIGRRKTIKNLSGNGNFE